MSKEKIDSLANSYRNEASDFKAKAAVPKKKHSKAIKQQYAGSATAGVGLTGLLGASGGLLKSKRARVAAGVLGGGLTVAGGIINSRGGKKRKAANKEYIEIRGRKRDRTDNLRAKSGLDFKDNRVARRMATYNSNDSYYNNLK